MKASRSMITKLATATLGIVLQLAWPMCRARGKEEMAEANIAARFWNDIGAVGETLEAAVDCVATRWGIDISAYMINRAYGF